MFLVLLHVFYFCGKYIYSYLNKKEGDVNVPQIKSKEYYMMDLDTLDDYKSSNIKFRPPAYIQRYQKVIEILNSDKYKGKIQKVVDFGCAKLNFFVYLKSIRELEEILCVDIDRSTLESNKHKVVPIIFDHIFTRTKELVVHVYEGSVTNYDKKLRKTDAVICIELIEHLYPDALIDFPYNIFGCIKPKVAIVTTPNADFNVLFNNFSGTRHYDHKFEWTREQFQDWANNIVLRYSDYQVTFHGICNGPEGTEHLGPLSQMAVFHRNYEKNDSEVLDIDNVFKLVVTEHYPFKIDNRSDEQKILDEVTYHVNRTITFKNVRGEISLKILLSLLSKFNVTMESLKIILEEGGWPIVDREDGLVTFMPDQSNTNEDNNFSLSNDNSSFSNDSSSFEESETSVDYNGYINSEDYNDSWVTENWDDDEPIVVPQNNSIIEENNTYLYDAELSNINYSDRDNFQINSNILSDSDTACNSNLHNDNNTFIKPIEKVHRTLDLQHSTSVLSNSIFPQPLLVHMDQLNSSYCDDIVIDNNMCSSLLNNTFRSLDVKDESVDLEKTAASYNMPFNTSLNEKLLECINYNQIEINDCYEGSITELEQESTKKKNINYEDHFVIEDCVSASITNQPQYTSSPKTKETSFNRKSADIANVRDSNVTKKDFGNTNVSMFSLKTSLLTYPSTDKSDKEKCLSYTKENSDLILKCKETETVNSIQSETYLINTVAECKESLNSFISKDIKCPVEIVEINTNSPDLLQTPSNSCSQEIMNSGYSNTAQDTPPKYDLSSLAHDKISDSESPSVAEASRFEFSEPVIIENGDLANNNRDREGNNMMAVADDIENLQPFINVLENDLENENDIVENDFPI